jgi:hypothetical protein
VLGGLVERYMFISVERYGAQWTYDITEFPVVVIMFIITLYGIASPYISQARQKRKDIAAGITTSQVATFSFNKRGFDLDFAFGAAIAVMFIIELSIASTWEFGARLIPQVMGYLALIILSFFLFAKLFYQAGAKMVTTKDVDGNDITKEEAESDVHFDIVVDFGDLPKETITRRALAYFGWCGFFFLMAATVGLLVSMFLFLVGYIRFWGKATWGTTMLIVGILLWIVPSCSDHSMATVSGRGPVPGPPDDQLGEPLLGLAQRNKETPVFNETGVFFDQKKAPPKERFYGT